MFYEMQVITQIIQTLYQLTHGIRQGSQLIITLLRKQVTRMVLPNGDH
jgi:hypothetical protein